MDPFSEGVADLRTQSPDSFATKIRKADRKTLILFCTQQGYKIQMEILSLLEKY